MPKKKKKLERFLILLKFAQVWVWAIPEYGLCMYFLLQNHCKWK